MSQGPLAAASQLASETTIWQKDGRRQLHWRDWGADSVVYDARSGHTLKFPPLAAAAMACFEEAPNSLVGLALTLGLADADALTLHVEVEAPLQAVVAHFLELGWTVPVLAPASNA